jgi:hypothetical protein
MVAVFFGAILILYCSHVDGQSQTPVERVDAPVARDETSKTRPAEEPGDESAVTPTSTGGSDGAPSWRFGAGYFDKIKERDSENFVSMAAAAGAPAGISRGVSVAGAIYKIGNLSFGGVKYYSKDIIN